MGGEGVHGGVVCTRGRGVYVGAWRVRGVWCVRGGVVCVPGGVGAHGGVGVHGGLREVVAFPRYTPCPRGGHPRN